MTTARKRRRSPMRRRHALTLVAVAMASPSAARAAAPSIDSSWAAAVFSTSARLQAKINPNGLATTYHFDYITKAAYEANLRVKDPFTGASRAPRAADANIGSGSVAITVLQLLSGLEADTAYRYRVVAKNAAPAPRTARPCPSITQASRRRRALADNRGWEMVSPVDKNGGEVALPGAVAGGGVLAGRRRGRRGHLRLRSLLRPAAQGAPPASQYVSTRTGGGWSTAEHHRRRSSRAPMAPSEEGVPYQLFSADLARGLLLNGEHCRGEGSGCPVANPPLAGTDAPAGYQNYYLREGQRLRGAARRRQRRRLSTLEPADFDSALRRRLPDLRHVVLSSCAALTADATEVPARRRLRSRPSTTSTSGPPAAGAQLLSSTDRHPGAALAAQAGAVSADGSRVYWHDLRRQPLPARRARRASRSTRSRGRGDLRDRLRRRLGRLLHQRTDTSGAIDAASDAATDLTPAGGVVGSARRLRRRLLRLLPGRRRPLPLA